MDLLEIYKEYNLVNDQTMVKANYDLSKRETSIQILIDRNGNLIILGVVDNNYIYWASLTKTEDKHINEIIFNHLANDPYDKVSHSYQALRTKGIEYEDLKHWYQASLVRESKDNMVWKTPFGHYYGADQIENNGKYFANDVSRFLANLQERCEFRECNGEYIKVLEYYRDVLLHNQMDSDYMIYYKVKPLEEILRKEDYLRVSTNSEIRELYIQCIDVIGNLYNRYMSVAR